MVSRHLGQRRGWLHGVTRVLPFVLLVAGLAVVGVPLGIRAITDWRNAHAVSALSGAAQAMDEDVRTGLLANAHAYNDVLAGTDPVSDEAAGGLSEHDVLPYGEQLAAGRAEIAWIEVPKIGLNLLIYRGTESGALASGVGHLEGSSLPVGGSSTHCVLTGHSGLATSRMFDDIRQLEDGDVFVLHTLGEELAYEVYGTEVVWPEETDSLGIVSGEDLVTLVTCTPYGVNDHRLLVHARRCEAVDEARTPAVEERDITWWLVLAGVLLCGTKLRGSKSRLAHD